MLIERAAVALSDESLDRDQAVKLHGELQRVLSGTDPFWMNWRYVGERRGWLDRAPGEGGPATGVEKDVQ